jgi:hypothetical protein
MALTRASFSMINNTVINVLDYGATGDGTTDDTAAIQAAIDASLVSGVGFSMVWFPTGVYVIGSPLLLPANYRLDGDSAEIKAKVGFTGVTRTNVGDGGTVTLDCLLLFLLGDYNNIAGPQRDRAYVGQGLKLNCNEVTKSGIYMERMPYSYIACQVINTIAGGNAIDIGTYCWGVHLENVVVEDFSENAIGLGIGCNGITITSPCIWGKSKTGVSGIFIKAVANVNGVSINGGFIEKLDYGLYVSRGNGPISINGTDFEVCTTNCIGVYGNGADDFKATVSATGCYFSATGVKIFATSAIVNIDTCRFRSGNDFDTDGPGGFISATNNQYETGTPTIVAGSNVAVDIEQSWTPVLFDDSLSPSEGQTYAIQYGTYSRVANKVFYKGNIQMSSLGTLTTGNTARIGGLPFASSNIANSQSAMTVGFAGGMSIGAANALTGFVGASLSHVDLQKFSSTAGTANLTIAEVSASGQLIFEGWYTV